MGHALYAVMVLVEWTWIVFKYLPRAGNGYMDSEGSECKSNARPFLRALVSFFDALEYFHEFSYGLLRIT